MTFNGIEHGLQQYRTFFQKNTKGFKECTPQNAHAGPFRFCHHYPKYGCKIVIELPYAVNTDGHVVMQGCLIQIYLKKTTVTKDHHLYLKNIRIGKDTEHILQQRIALLQKLVLDTKKCPRCGQWMFPHISHQKPPREKTRFVSFYCAQCDIFQPTTYGIGLKTELHRRIGWQLIVV